MKIGIYNRYWNTYGGGENYTGSIAQVLSADHEVELISIEPVDWSKLQERLRLDFSRCTTQQWPNDSCIRLSPLTSGYDVFVNGTYGSSIVPRSLRSVLLCYFPHQIAGWRGIRSMIGSAIKNMSEMRARLRPCLSNGLDGIVPLAGAYSVEPDGRCWLGPTALLSITQKYSGALRIPLWPGAYRGVSKVIVDGSPCEHRLLGDDLIIASRSMPEQPSSVLIFSVSMTPSGRGDSLDARQLGVCVDTRKISWKDHPNHIKQLVPPMNLADSLACYDRIVSISQYTTEWIQKRWGLSSYELQPPIDTEVFCSDGIEPRDRLILSVGRFFAGGHNKKHHEMAQAFIRMRKEGRIPENWRLVLIGARHLEYKRHIRYFEALQRMCAGQPIDIMVDLPFQELLKYYRKAAIYWHAAGWGERENSHPERLEHFGITTCEAMASGCVPLVYEGAGQIEIVTEGQSGYVFKNYATLSRRMQELTAAHESGSLDSMSREARKSVSRFAQSGFGTRVRDAFQGIVY